MITEYPLEQRRYDQSEYEPFWAAAEARGMPLSLHTATRRQGRIRAAREKILRDARSPARKVGGSQQTAPAKRLSSAGLPSRRSKCR
jgi:hypothetical protein